MPIGQLMIDGRRYMVVEESEYTRLLAASAGGEVREEDLPPLPKADAHGNVPALDYARASLARKLIIQRRSRGWSQAELAQGEDARRNHQPSRKCQAYRRPRHGKKDRSGHGNGPPSRTSTSKDGMMGMGSGRRVAQKVGHHPMLLVPPSPISPRSSRQ